MMIYRSGVYDDIQVYMMIYRSGVYDDIQECSDMLTSVQ